MLWGLVGRGTFEFSFTRLSFEIECKSESFNSDVFDFSGDIEYIYEVLNVTKEKLLYTHYGRQNLTLKRMDKTDILYTFPFVLFS